MRKKQLMHWRTIAMSLTLILSTFAFELSAQVFIDEDFNACSQPANWSINSNYPSMVNCTWSFGDTLMPTGPVPGSGCFALFDDDACVADDSSDIDLLSPVVNTAGATFLELSFNYAHQDFAGDGEFTVDVFDGTTWQQIFFVTVDQVGSFSQEVTQYANANFQVRFNYFDDISSSWGVGIDDVLLRNITCPSPSNLMTSNITSTTATGSWVSNGAGSSFELEIGAAGFTQGTGIINVALDTFYNATGLSANTLYDWYVREICTPGDTSFWSGPMTFKTSCASQLSGTVTIDAGSASSATNFTNFTSLASEINVCGIGGPLTVNVVPNSGPYAERVVFGEILGSSATNTITINGNGNILTNSTSTSAERATLLLEGTDYLTVNDLTIEALGTSAFGVHLTAAANFNTIDNCVININPTSTSTFTGGIILSNTLTSATSTGDISSNNTFSNNTITGGYYGVNLFGSSTTIYGVANKVLNNTISDFYQSGVRMRYQEDVEVIGNDISRANRTAVTSFYGFYVEDETPGGLFADNRIHDNSTQATSSTSIAYPIYFTSANGTPAKPVRVQNNAVYNINGNGTTYGAYFTSPGDDIQFYHNSIVLDNASQTGTSAIRGIFHAGPAVNFDHKNNLVYVNNGNSGDHYGLYLSNSSPGATSDNNIVSIVSPNSTNYFGRIGTTNYSDLASWQTATTQDANSSETDPILASPSTGDLTPLNGATDNIGTPVGVLTDITGAARSVTTPDAGAYEFTGLSIEMALVGASLERGSCYSTNDTAILYIQNIGSSMVDFSVNPLLANWSVSGPINSLGDTTINTGTLAASDTLIISFSTVDMSLPGTYLLDANISPNATNLIASNDSIFGVTENVVKILNASPTNSLVTSPTGTVELRANSSFFPSAGFFITEICQFQSTSSGEPVNTPSYFSGFDDYLEITGAPGSDLGGYTIEQWSTTSQTGSTYTFPQGTQLNSSGTAVIAIGSSGTDDPANALYFASVVTSSASSTATGKILRDPSGNIVDAVGHSGSSTSYSFPAAANVSVTDWDSGPALPSSSSSWGIRLEGADMNSGMNWVASSTSPQDPNTVNTSVTVPTAPSISNFEWTLNGIQVTTNTSYVAGPFTTNGIREYVAVYNDTANCGVITDTAIVDVQIPINELSLTAFDVITNGCALGINENITMTIVNNGIAAQTGFPVTFQVDAQTAVTEVIATTLNSGDTLVYTFTTGADLSATGFYNIVAFVDLATDEDRGNDSTSVSGLNSPLITSFPYSEDFESGAGNWISGGANNSWQLGTPAGTIIDTAASGTNAWVTNLTGDYNANEASFVESPCFDFTGLVTPGISLNIQKWAEFSWDGAAIEVSTDAGQTWTLLGADGDPNNWYNDGTIGGLQTGFGFGDGWTDEVDSNFVAASRNISNTGGLNNVKLRVVFGSDGSGEREGIAFDDINIIETTLADDIAVISIDNLSSGCGLSSTSIVEATIVNLGLNNQTGFDISYVINSGTPITEVVSATINAGDTLVYTFSAAADLSMPMVYDIDIYSGLNNDLENSNDTASISIESREIPVLSVSDLNICDPQNVQLVAGASLGTVTWTDSSGNVLSTSDTLDLGLVSSSQGVFVEAVTETSAKVGPIDNTFGPGGNFAPISLGAQSILFEAFADIVLDSVTLFADGPGTVEIVLRDAAGINILQSVVVNVTGAANGEVVPVGFSILAGNYRLGSTSNSTSGLYRNTSGASYPYSIPGIVSIDGNTFDPVYYYFYYNWQVRIPGCSSGQQSVLVNYGETPSVNFSATQAGFLTVSFFSSIAPAPDSVSWDFGDGTDTTVLNPTHLYVAPGTYSVSLTAYLNGCDSTITKTTDVLAGLNKVLTQQVDLYPNPTEGKFVVNAEGLSFDKIEVRDMLGNLVFQNEKTFSNQAEFNINNIATGTYIVTLINREGMAIKRLTIK